MGGPRSDSIKGDTHQLNLHTLKDPAVQKNDHNQCMKWQRWQQMVTRCVSRGRLLHCIRYAQEYQTTSMVPHPCPCELHVPLSINSQSLSLPNTSRETHPCRSRFVPSFNCAVCLRCKTTHSGMSRYSVWGDSCFSQQFFGLHCSIKDITRVSSPKQLNPNFSFTYVYNTWPCGFMTF